MIHNIFKKLIFIHKTHVKIIIFNFNNINHAYLLFLVEAATKLSIFFDSHYWVILMWSLPIIHTDYQYLITPKNDSIFYIRYIKHNLINAVIEYFFVDFFATFFVCINAHISYDAYPKFLRLCEP